MIISTFFALLLLCSTLSANGPQTEAAVHLNGNYHMILPNDGAQYVFAINWSDYLNRYVVVVTGQTVAWATATLEVINATAVNLVCDNGNTLVGVISYNQDLPSICWPTSAEYTCWNRLLSNVSRIHVINM